MVETLPLIVWTSFFIIGSLALFVPVAVVFIWKPSKHVPKSPVAPPRVIVLVLGDIGRSPRMQNHALSIARNGGKVDLVGYDESIQASEILQSPNIEVHGLPAPPGFLTTSSKLLFPIFAPLKIALQLVVLLKLLLYTIPPEASQILVQNPPSMPTFVVAIIAARLRGFKFVIDWHNFGWSILALKLGPNAPIVGLAKWYEQVFGGFADAHFTVTHAMAGILKEQYGFKAPISVLHDRPPRQFKPLTTEERKLFLQNCPATADYSESILSGKTRLLISSTSWTPDEDIQILLEALVVYDREASLSTFLPGSGSKQGLPDIIAVLTGKGPLKAAYEAAIGSMDFQSVRVKTVWLEQDDYPKMVASADVGVSLHTSSSGVDLPMKVVDLFGGGVPVLAIEYQAIGELVKEQGNGRLFKNSEQLAQCLCEVFGEGGKALERLKEGALVETKDRWEERWDRIAKGVLGF